MADEARLTIVIEEPTSAPTGGGGGTGGNLIDVRAAYNAGTSTNGGFGSNSAFDSIRGQISSHLAGGGRVTAWYDGRAVNITAVRDGKMIDDQGQPWGMMPLAMGTPGTKSGIELHPPPTPVATAQSASGGTSSAASASAGAADGFPGWYPRYRELKNRADDGRLPLSPAEKAELGGLSQQLSAFAAGPAGGGGAPAAGPAPRATGTYGFASDRPPPPPGAAPDLPPIPLAGDRAEPYGVRGAPAAGPNPWATGLAGAAGADADARAAERDNRKAAARDQRKANRNAFAAATANLSPGKQALLGGLVGGAKASRAGGSFFAGAGKGAMAAAGGPVGLAAAAVGVAEEIKKKITQAPIDGINALADAAKMAAGNDGMGLFKKGAEAATGALEKIPVAGEAIALPFKVATAAATALADVAGVFVARGRALSGYSGELAGSAARADVADLTADIREAQVLGPDTARLMDTMTDLNQMVREGLLPIKQIVVEVLAGTLTDVKEAARGVLAILAQPSNFIPKGLREWAERVLKALEGGADPDTLIQDWLGAADDLGPMPAIPGGGAPAPAGFGRAGAGGIGLPAFGRG